MSVVQTRNKSAVFGILLSALIVGMMLTVGQYRWPSASR